MKFQPKTQKQIDEDRLLPDGEYPFQISVGEDKISKTSGNEMIALTVRVFKPDGNFILVNDYLLESMAYKLRHAAEACDMLAEYESGTLTGDMFVGKTGSLKLKTDPGKGSFPAKNVIGDYIVPKAGEAKREIPKQEDPFVSDEIPF